MSNGNNRQRKQHRSGINVSAMWRRKRRKLGVMMAGYQIVAASSMAAML